MSGSLNSNDIEDVVSSVRRLVSVDARPRPVTRDLGADRLLLTPALRIVPDAAAEPVATVPLILTGAVPLADDLPAAAPTAERAPSAADAPGDATLVLAEPADAVPAADEGATDAGGEETASPDAQPETPAEPEAKVAALVLTEPAALEDLAPEAEMPEAIPSEAIPSEAIPSEAIAAEAIAAEAVTPAVTPVEPAALDAEGAVEPQPLHLVEDEWEDEIWAEADPPLAELALGAEEAELVLSEDAADPLMLQAGAAPPPLTAHSDLDPDAPWAQVEGDWADDLPDPVVPLDARRAQPLPEPEADPPRSEAVELTDPDGNPLTILDEAALQEVVRQLIREELQGSLGERITRNVRKLVRAEINRALTARSLD